MFPSGTYGIDNVDLLAAVAPRPLLVTIEHYAPPFNRAAAAILARYELLGAGDKFKTVPADDPHAWTVKLRIANTDWFSRWFYNRPGPQSEAPFTPEPWENLWCTVDGSIEYSRQGQTIYSLILKTQATLPPERKAPTSSSELVSYRSELGETLHSPRAMTPRLRARVTRSRSWNSFPSPAFTFQPGSINPTPESRTGRRFCTSAIRGG